MRRQRESIPYSRSRFLYRSSPLFSARSVSFLPFPSSFTISFSLICFQFFYSLGLLLRLARAALANRHRHGTVDTPTTRLRGLLYSAFYWTLQSSELPTPPPPLREGQLEIGWNFYSKHPLWGDCHPHPHPSHPSLGGQKALLYIYLPTTGTVSLATAINHFLSIVAVVFVLRLARAAFAHGHRHGTVDAPTTRERGLLFLNISIYMSLYLPTYCWYLKLHAYRSFSPYTCCSVRFATCLSGVR